MLYRTRQNFNRVLFNVWGKEILSTDPIPSKPSKIKIVSMVSHLDLIMYLVAIKSFYSRLEEGQPIVLDDGTLTVKDIDILNVHLSEPEIVKITEIPTGTCPKGGCWERILFISDCVEDNYE